jgi:hypothetical protein
LNDILNLKKIRLNFNLMNDNENRIGDRSFYSMLILVGAGFGYLVLFILLNLCLSKIINNRINNNRNIEDTILSEDSYYEEC